MAKQLFSKLRELLGQFVASPHESDPVRFILDLTKEPPYAVKNLIRFQEAVGPLSVKGFLLYAGWQS